ncbi:MAG TPA: PAS domain S-box protein [Tepidisphaeraceae bacterium]
MSVERSPIDTRVLLLAPTPRDGEVTCRLMTAGGIRCELPVDLPTLGDELRRGAAAIIVPEEVVLSPAASHLAETLTRQPVWSDVPVIILSRAGVESPAVERAMATFGNVSVVERPVRMTTLLSVVRTALRARERQYQVRDQLIAQQKTEAALRDSEERFRAAFDQAIVGIVLVDLDGNVIRVNDAFCEIVGRPSESLVGHDSSLYTHPDDRRQNAENIRRIETESLQSSVYEKRYIRPDGSVVWVQASLSPLRDRDGNLNRILAVVENINDRKLAREALAHSEARLRMIFESVKDYAIFTIDRTGIVTSWNIGAQRLFGYADTEIMHTSSAVLWTPEDQLLRMMEEEMRQALCEGAGNDERWHQRKDGSRFLASGLLMPLYNDAEEVIGFTKVCRDVTAARQAERELADTRAQLEATLAAGEVGTWLWRIPEDHLTGDANLARMFNLNVEEVTNGAPAARYIQSIHPDDQGPVEEALSAVLTHGINYEIEYRVMQADRSVRWVLARGTIERDAAGRAVRLPGVVLDITERKLAEDAARESEARFRQLADSMPQIVWSALPDGEVDYFNQPWYDYTGLKSGQTGDASWTPVVIDADLVAKYWRESVASGEAFSMEYRVRRAADGQERWHLGRARPIHDSSGRIIRWFGTITDVHDYKQLQEENASLLDSERAARTEAERTSRMKDEFLATLSHELRTPLNAILGWSQIMRSSSADAEDLQQGLEVVERNARSQAQIIEDLLDMSRIISGKVRLDVQPVDLESLLQAAIDTTRPAADAKGIVLHAHLDQQLPTVNGDPNRLQQVLWNLLSNAIKFTPRGGHVWVTLRKRDGNVEVKVADSGEGIKAEFLPFVFDRFRQADATTTRRHGGLGLGLSIVKQLIELHGGSIAVESDGVNRGSTFIVSLPLMIPLPSIERDEKRPLPTSAHGATPSQMTLSLQGLKILVVDDEPDARLLVKRLLEDYQANVVMAASASEALAITGEYCPNVLISDIGMPGEDGYALIRRIRSGGSDNARVPAIALTAYARPEDRVKAMVAGFNMHICKPIEPAELVAIIASLTGRNQ